MKQSKFFLGMAVASAMFSACSNDESYENIAPVSEGEQIISLAVDNGGDAFRGSRAVGPGMERPLYSSEAKQNIDKVSLWICNDKDSIVVYDKTLTDWNANGSKPYTEGGNGRMAQLVLAGNDRLAEGKYTIYAIGYSSLGKTYTKATIPTKEDKFNPEKFVAESDGSAAEIFATSKQIQVVNQGQEKGTEFKESITLHRQVAGIYAYLTNLPYEEGMTEKATLVIKASQNLNTKLAFGFFKPDNNADLPNNGENTSSNVINANTPGSSNLVATINLNEWFTKIQDANKDGLIDTDTWHQAKSYDKNDVTFKKGSVFVGQFIHPFKKVKGTNTFVMYLTKDGSTNTQYSWNINLSEGNKLTNANITVWNGTKFGEEKNYSETTREYSVFRNHLYAIGHKVHDKNPNPGPGPDPNPDPDPEDKPVEVNHTQELTLKVNDNWEVIHNMDVE